MCRPVALVLPVVLAACLGAMPRAHASVPDSATMAAMRAAAAQGHGLRLTGSFGTQEFRHVEVDSSGIRKIVPYTRPALFVAADTPSPAPAAPIPWSEIEEVRTTHQHKLLGMLAGAGLGFTVSAVTIGLRRGTRTDDNFLGSVLLIGNTIAGGLVGTFVGSLSGSKTLYRSQESH